MTDAGLTALVAKLRDGVLTVGPNLIGQLAADAITALRAELASAEERSSEAGYDLGHAVGLAAATTRAETAERERDAVQRALDAEEKCALESGGILSDVCDWAFGDEMRAEIHGYDGVMEQVRSLVRDRTDLLYSYQLAQERERSCDVQRLNERDRANTERAARETGERERDAVRRDLDRERSMRADAERERDIIARGIEFAVEDLTTEHAARVAAERERDEEREQAVQDEVASRMSLHDARTELVQARADAAGAEAKLADVLRRVREEDRSYRGENALTYCTVLRHAVPEAFTPDATGSEAPSPSTVEAPSNVGCDHCCGSVSDHERGCPLASAPQPEALPRCIAHRCERAIGIPYCEKHERILGAALDPIADLDTPQPERAPAGDDVELTALAASLRDLAAELCGVDRVAAADALTRLRAELASALEHATMCSATARSYAGIVDDLRVATERAEKAERDLATARETADHDSMTLLAACDSLGDSLDATKARARELERERDCCSREHASTIGRLANAERDLVQARADAAGAEAKLAEARRALQRIADVTAEANVVASEALDAMYPCTLTPEREGAELPDGS